MAATDLVTELDKSELIAISKDLMPKNNASMEFSIELIEDIFKNYNLAKAQIASQDLLELKQSLITLNSLLVDFKSDSFGLNEKYSKLMESIDNSYILLMFIQRKSMILKRYRKLLKKFFFDKMKGCINEIQDSPIREQLKVLITKLEYIENNRHSISGYLQNCCK